MADEQLIKPRELPPAAAVYSDDAIMTDDGVSVTKATPSQIVDAGSPVASEAEAVSGVDNTKRMTPLRVRQVLDNTTAPSVLRAQAWAESNTNPDPSIPGSKSAKTLADEAGVYAAMAESAARAANKAPQSWDDFQTEDFLDLLDGSVTQFNGVQFVRDQSANIAGLPTGAGWGVLGHPSPYHWGAVLDGVSDDTEAIRNLHAYCNESFARPSYKGVSTFAVQADGGIVVNTSVDFNGAQINLIGGMVETPSYAGLLIAFKVEDPARPVVAHHGAAEAGRFNLNSMTSCGDFAAQDGWAFTQFSNGTNLPVIAQRYGGTPLSYRTAHRTLENGTTEHPVVVDGSGVTERFAWSRANSENGRIYIQNFTTDISQYNCQAMFRVERNEVTVRNFSLKGKSPAVTMCRFISSYRNQGLRIDDVSGSGFENVENAGTYVLDLLECASVKVSNVEVSGYWSWAATHFTNGQDYYNCDFDRVDVHEYGLNINVENCVFRKRGANLGQGGGYYRIHNCVQYLQEEIWPLLAGRPDYGAQWDGEIEVSDCTIIPMAFGSGIGVGIVSFSQYGIGDASTVVQAPKSIVVRDVNILRRQSGSGVTKVTPVSLNMKPGSAGVISPSQISVSGITCLGRWRMHNLLDIMNMTNPTLGVSTRIDISNCVPTEPASVIDNSLMLSTSTLLIPAGASRAVVVNVENVHLATLSLAGVTSGAARVYVCGGSLCRVASGNGVEVVVKSCTLRQPVFISPTTRASIGGSRVSNRYVSLLSCEVIGDFDLSNASVLSGVAMDLARSPNVSLPVGVTRPQALTGWIDPAIL